MKMNISAGHLTVEQGISNFHRKVSCGEVCYWSFDIGHSFFITLVHFRHFSLFDIRIIVFVRIRIQSIHFEGTVNIQCLPGHVIRI